MVYVCDQNVRLTYRIGDLLMATGYASTGQPARPYGSADDLGGNAPRSPQFQTGLTGDPDSAATVTTRPDAGLTADSMQWTAQAGGGYRPSSVLTPIMKNPGGLGMSAGDAARRTFDGQYLGSVVGTSESSFGPAAMLRLSGLNSE